MNEKQKMQDQLTDAINAAVIDHYNAEWNRMNGK